MSYSVREVFFTVQGEGCLAGTPAVFVRFAGCNLWSGREQDRATGKGACARWCDTDFVGGNKFSADEIVEQCLSVSSHQVRVKRWVVLTGGEPALQIDSSLLFALRGRGFSVAVETNGAVNNPALAIADWLTLSPKLGGEVTLTVCPGELKVVLPGVVDGEGWSDKQLEALAGRFEGAVLTVQPQDNHDQGAAAVARCVDFVNRHDGWRIGVQAHKFWKLP